MDYLRGQNIVHRDVKPGNILRVQQANGKYVFSQSFTCTVPVSMKEIDNLHAMCIVRM